MSGNEEMRAAWDGAEGDHWSDHADSYEAASRRYGAVLIEAADLDQRSAVLDIGCGTGSSALAAGRIATAGSVLGVDLSSWMLERARASAVAQGLDHVFFEQADAQVHPFPASTYDVVISAFGAMFFADPVAAFANVRRSLRPGAVLALVAWRDLERNEWVGSVRAALAAGRELGSPPPGVAGPFSLADRDITTGFLDASGYVDIELTSIDEPLCFGSDGDDAYAFLSTGGITRGLTADLDPAGREEALARLRQTIDEHETADGVLFAGSAWLIRATNGEESR